MLRYALICIVALSTVTFGQLKTEAELSSIGESLNAPAPSTIFSFIDFSKIDMSHSFSTSFTAFGGNSLMLNSYVNTIRYQISDPLMLKFRLGLMNSPYSSMQQNLPALDGTQFFGGAELQYRPSDNMMLRLSVDRYPAQTIYMSPFHHRENPE